MSEDLPGLLANPEACAWVNTSVAAAKPLTPESLQAATDKIKADFMNGKHRGDAVARFPVPMDEWLRLPPRLRE